MQENLQLKEDVRKILEEITRLKAGNNYVLNSYLDQLTSYAETVCGDVEEPFDDQTETAGHDLDMNHGSPHCTTSPGAIEADPANLETLDGNPTIQGREAGLLSNLVVPSSKLYEKVLPQRAVDFLVAGHTNLPEMPQDSHKKSLRQWLKDVLAPIHVVGTPFSSNTTAGITAQGDVGKTQDSPNDDKLGFESADVQFHNQVSANTRYFMPYARNKSLGNEDWNIEEVEDTKDRVFGVPLKQSTLYAFVGVTIAGQDGKTFYRMDLPPIVAKCAAFLRQQGLLLISSNNKSIY